MVGTFYPSPLPQPRIPGPVLQMFSSVTPRASGFAFLFVCVLAVSHISGWPQTLYLAEDGLELERFLSLPPKL